MKVNTYKIKLRGYGVETLICDETAGKAKYQHYLQLDDLFNSFDKYLGFVESCRCLRKAKKEDYFRADRDFKRRLSIAACLLRITERKLN